MLYLAELSHIQSAKPSPGRPMTESVHARIAIPKEEKISA